MGERLLLHYGRILCARKQLALAATLEPDMASPHYHLAQAQHLLGMPEPARAEFLAAIRCTADSDYEREIAARSLYNLAAIVVNCGGDTMKRRASCAARSSRCPTTPRHAGPCVSSRRTQRSRERPVAPDKVPTS